MSDEKMYDVIIIGGGPAGLAAGLYTSRDRYETLILEKNYLPGGQIMLTEHIENYPGHEKISGPDLVQNMRNQAEHFGAKIQAGKTVDALNRRDDGIIEIEVSGQEPYLAHAVILAPGSDYRQLGVEGEQEMRQATRVSYCATCDGAFYRDKHVLTVGGGNTAVEDTLYLAKRFTGKATIIHRRKEFRAQKVLVEELYEAADEHNIDIKLPYVLERLVPTADGTDLDHAEIRNVETDQIENIHVDGVFIFAGMVPNTKWLAGTVDLTDVGYIICDPVTLKTTMPGVFAAGDCRHQAAMQLATASADGVISALMIKDYFRDPSDWKGSFSADGRGW